MPTAEPARKTAAGREAGKAPSVCYHCGLPCLGTPILLAEKSFCCDGCRLVFEVLNSKGLCNYYELQQHPGLQAVRPLRNDKFAYLDEPAIADQLCSFSDGEHTIVTFYLPGVHCSSCMWLLEHLRRLHEGITESRLHFGAKEVTIHFSKSKVSLREVAELLATIGYEPAISLEDGSGGRKQAKSGKARIYRLGVAGFCFSFIMMMSFPEYFAGAGFEARYAGLLRGLNLLLALPVFFFCAGEFFTTAWKGLRARTLNIDAPIALAILITFLRSLWEIGSGTGAGYLDSMSGIVFFMLIGRVVQERTYRSISFHRDYKSYFPIAVTVLAETGVCTRSLHELKKGDVVLLHNEEIIPADGIVLQGSAHVDYSFVTGESEPVRARGGEKVYAGGRQLGERISVQLSKPVAGSYLTSLWNNQAFARDKAAEGRAGSSIHAMSRYFTLVLFTLAVITGLYWAIADASRLLNAVTAMLIVACPCALLLASTFTNGNLLRLFSRAGLFLRDASVIEQLGRIDFIAFDKTGTLTSGTEVGQRGGSEMGEHQRRQLLAAVSPSRHPYSRALAGWSRGEVQGSPERWEEIAGQGIRCVVDGQEVLVGSETFTGVRCADANVHVRIGADHYSFLVAPQFRSGLRRTIDRLRERFQLALLSGDTNRQQGTLRELFGKESLLSFRQQPADKLALVARLQGEGHRVLMIGDGLNDAGALQQSNVGITLTEDVNNFTPACDAILDAKRFHQLPALLQLARAGKRIIWLSFFVSMLYNIVGLTIAVQGRMNPMIAAILMPASTLSIVLLSTGATALTAWRLRLK